jgi:hypothetical protein
MLMFRRRILVTVVVGLGMQVAASVEGAGEGDADPRYAATITSKFGGKPVRLVLTGTAMRTKFGFSVYAIGSYVQEGVKVRNGDELAKVAAAKQLHLIFERDVDGETMAQSFRDSIGMGHPAPAFAAELAKLEAYFRSNPVKRGNSIWLTYVPGVGLGCQLTGKPGTLIENVGFAQAAWEVYLGRKNLGVAIKTGLTSRL